MEGTLRRIPYARRSAQSGRTRRHVERHMARQGGIRMQEMDRRVALLRLLLADITAREGQAREAHEQLHGQLTRIVDFTVRQNAGVGHALSAMEEVEERLAQQEAMLRHLALLRVRAQGELQALLVTRGSPTPVLGLPNWRLAVPPSSPPTRLPTTTRLPRSTPRLPTCKA